MMERRSSPRLPKLLAEDIVDGALGEGDRVPVDE